MSHAEQQDVQTQEKVTEREPLEWVVAGDFENDAPGSEEPAQAAEGELTSRRYTNKEIIASFERERTTGEKTGWQHMLAPEKRSWREAVGRTETQPATKRRVGAPGCFAPTAG